LLFTFSVSSANELAAIDLSKHASGDSTVDQYQYYVQGFTERLELNDVLQIADWIQPQPSEVTHGFSDSPSWMKFSLANPTDKLKDIILEYVDASAQTIDVYYRKQGSNLHFQHMNFTFNAPIEDRPVAFYRPAFPLHVPAQEVYEVYIRIFQGNDFPMHSFTSMRIWDVKSFNRASHIEMVLLIILLCTEIFMGIATLIAFAFTRDTLFLYYAGFAFSGVLLFSGLSGVWSYFIVGSGFELWMVVLQISICQIAAILFVRRFLNIKQNLPWVDSLLLAIVWVGIIGVILNLTGSPYFSRIIIDYTAFAYLFLLPVGLNAQKKGVPHALLFTSSWLVFILGMAISSLRYRGYIADSFWTEWLIYFGGFIEAFLLTTVMALSMRDLFREKQVMENNHRIFLENSADELSKKVWEQTKLLQHAKDTAEEEARTDMLTGLTNRRSFFELAERFIERAKRSKHESLYLLTIDIDKFKVVNDTFGHAAGDAVLVEVAQTIQKITRSVDLVSRLGGEEFGVVMENESRGGVEELCERLREGIAQLQVRFEGNLIPVTISIGVACWAKDIPWNIFMQASDKALFKAKSQGRNCVVHD
jgi:diguanylate cyclase (GGDEF)-like protein